MTINKAIEHFRWKFENVWTASIDDKKAFDTIAKFINDKHKNQFNNHQLFAKLYITYYGELLKYYRTDVFDDIPQKELHKVLNRPLERIIEDFVKKATDIEQSLQYEVNGVLKHPLQLSSDQKESIEILDAVMTYDEAEKNLTSLINLAINEFG